MNLIRILFRSKEADALGPIRDALRAAEPEAQAGPWRQVATLAVGGLTAVGFDRGSETLLVTSADGQSVMDATTGTRLYRNHARNGFDGSALKAARLDHPALERVDMAGLEGGGLRRSTSDGWSVETLAPDWPETCCVLHPPRASIWFLKPGWSRGIKDPSFHLLARCHEIRAFGFSWTGRSLVLATPDSLTIWARPAPLHLV